MPRRSLHFQNIAKRNGTNEEDDDGCSTQQEKAAVELTNDGNKGILYKGVLYEGYDPRYLPTAYLHCDNWPDPLPNLNLTVTEKDIWYEGERITFTT
jgi:hypothetical protein